MLTGAAQPRHTDLCLNHFMQVGSQKAVGVVSQGYVCQGGISTRSRPKATGMNALMGNAAIALAHGQQGCVRLVSGWLVDRD